MPKKSQKIRPHIGMILSVYFVDDTMENTFPDFISKKFTKKLIRLNLYMMKFGIKT